MLKEYHISEIGEVVGGGTPSTKNEAFWGGEIPWITPKDLANYNSIYISKGQYSITEDGLRSGSRLLPENTVLFTSRAPIGYVAIAKNKIATNQGFKSIICDEKKCHHLYLYYFLKSNLSYIKLFGSGSTFPEISGSVMKKIKINIFADVAKQKKIASILSAYDDLIEKNNRKIAILQQMAEELYKEWFVRFRFPGYKTVKFYKGLPEGWEYGTIKDLGSFVRGKNITADEMEEGDIPVISAGIEPSGFHNESNVQGISITISSSGANAGFLRINYSDIWAADCSFLNDIENIFYMYELLNNMRPCIDNLQRGAAQPHVYPKDINKLKIVLPPIQLRTKFNEMAKQVHLAIATLQKQNKNLTQQRDLLLPRLMSGKLKVKA